MAVTTCVLAIERVPSLKCMKIGATENAETSSSEEREFVQRIEKGECFLRKLQC